MYYLLVPHFPQGLSKPAKRHIGPGKACRHHRNFSRHPGTMSRTQGPYVNLCLPVFWPEEQGLNLAPLPYFLAQKGSLLLFELSSCPLVKYKPFSLNNCTSSFTLINTECSEEVISSMRRRTLDALSGYFALFVMLKTKFLISGVLEVLESTAAVHGSDSFTFFTVQEVHRAKCSCISHEQKVTEFRPAKAFCTFDNDTSLYTPMHPCFHYFPHDIYSFFVNSICVVKSF